MLNPEQHEPVIRIDDPEVDLESIMSRLRENLAAHGLVDDVPFPEFAFARSTSRALGLGEEEGTSRLPKQVTDQLTRANLNYDQVWVELSLVEDEMPVVGPFITRFKRELHRLVIFYVNMLGERQVTVNDAVVRVLNHLVEELAQPAEVSQQMEALQRQVGDLRERLERLESQNG